MIAIPIFPVESRREVPTTLSLPPDDPGSTTVCAVRMSEAGCGGEKRESIDTAALNSLQSSSVDTALNSQ